MQNNLCLTYPKFITMELNRLKGGRLVNIDKNFFEKIDLNEVVSVSFFGDKVFDHPHLDFFLHKLQSKKIISSVDILAKRDDFFRLKEKTRLFSQIRLHVFSADKKLHDRLIGEKNNFADFEKYVVNNKDKDFIKKSKVILMPIGESNDSEKEIDNLYKLAKKNGFFFSPFISSKFDRIGKLSKKKYKRITQILADLYRKDRQRIMFLDEPLICLFTHEANLCPAGRLLIHIDVEGDYYPCRYSTYQVGRAGLSLTSVWKSFSKKREVCEECKDCQKASICGYGCIATKEKYLYNKDSFCFYSNS